ncbi:MAG TPA: anthrone oxygenase family protein [Streptosporangiaceae bacterium]|nr:anthrone oxygenase family protein [Streptosporangiaceae bacterium]
MRSLQSVTLPAATITAGLIAGLMFAYACSVMPGLGRSADRTLVETMQNINRAIINPWFMLPFVGSIPLIALAVALAWRGHGRPALPWLVAALVLYLVAFFITMRFNVPLNNALDRAGHPDHIGDIAAVRRHFEGTWVAWNIARTLVHLAAFGCLAWALVVYGGDRAQPSPHAKADVVTTHPALGAP